MDDGPRTLLLSGAQGLLGRAVARAWLAGDTSGTDGGARVVGFGRSSRLADRYPYDLDVAGVVAPAHLPAELRALETDTRYTYEQCDLADPAAVRELVGTTEPDVVVHAAAALRDDDPATLARTNVDGTRVLAAAAAAAAAVAGTRSARRFVLVSSGSVHGLAAARAAGVEPDPYPVSKLESEHAAASALAGSGVVLDVCRVFNLVGPGLQTRHLPARVAADLVAISAGRADPLLRLGSLGTSRDLVDVADAAAAVVACARRGSAATHEPATDVGSGTPTLMRDLVALLVRLAGLDGAVEVREGAPRPYDPPSLVADPTALRALGAPATTPLVDSCRALLGYLTVQLDATG